MNSTKDHSVIYPGSQSRVCPGHYPRDNNGKILLPRPVRPHFRHLPSCTKVDIRGASHGK